MANQTEFIEFRDKGNIQASPPRELFYLTDLIYELTCIPFDSSLNIGTLQTAHLYDPEPGSQDRHAIIPLRMRTLLEEQELRHQRYEAKMEGRKLEDDEIPEPTHLNIMALKALGFELRAVGTDWRYTRVVMPKGWTCHNKVNAYSFYNPEGALIFEAQTHGAGSLSNNHYCIFMT